jgi:hypothetical protein
MAFGLSAAAMSPLFTTFLSKWGYEGLTLAAGCTALTIGLPASVLIQCPEIELSGKDHYFKSRWERR